MPPRILLQRGHFEKLNPQWWSPKLQILYLMRFKINSPVKTPVAKLAKTAPIKRFTSSFLMKFGTTQLPTKATHPIINAVLITILFLFVVIYVYMRRGEKLYSISKHISFFYGSTSPVDGPQLTGDLLHP